MIVHVMLGALACQEQCPWQTVLVNKFQCPAPSCFCKQHVCEGHNVHAKLYCTDHTGHAATTGNSLKFFVQLKCLRL